MHRIHCVILGFLLLSACADPVAPGTPAGDAEPPATGGAASSSPACTSILDPARITKKPFGIRIDPATSPVQPERFHGYHTGADFEVRDGEDETAMEVPAICDGPIVLARRVGGYGGVVIQRCTIEGEAVTVLYGHLAPESLRAAGTELGVDESVGHLGRGFSAETDRERPHLHLAIHRGSAVELRGYVQDAAALRAWIDPIPMLPR